MKRQKTNTHRTILAATALAAAITSLAGCTQQPTILENPDPKLRHTVAELKTDSGARFPYKFEAPHVAEAKVRGQVEYDFDRLDIVNFSGEEWRNVEVWV